jgi:hypothetical protein
LTTRTRPLADGQSPLTGYTFVYSSFEGNFYIYGRAIRGPGFRGR